METENTWFTQWLLIPIYYINRGNISLFFAICWAQLQKYPFYSQGSWLTKKATKSTVGADKPLKILSLFKANEKLFVPTQLTFQLQGSLVNFVKQKLTSSISQSWILKITLWLVCEEVDFEAPALTMGL